MGGVSDHLHGRAVKPLVTETRSLGFPEARTSCRGGVTLSMRLPFSLPWVDSERLYGGPP